MADSCYVNAARVPLKHEVAHVSATINANYPYSALRTQLVVDVRDLDEQY